MANDEKIYEILSVRTSLYLDNGNAVNGYRVSVKLLPFNEVFDIDVPSIKTSIVEPVIKAYLIERVKLQGLGTIEDTDL